VIIFQKDSTKINVYYTTGTVGTRLNHPRHGKTQLFRRSVSLDQLEEIFENPRIHTGAGYHLRENSVWKPVHQHAEEPEDCDLARRWRFVHYATGLCDDTETENVVLFCNLWSSLEFADGVDCMSLGTVARDHHGARVILIYRVEQDDEQSILKEIPIVASCYCDAGISYHNSFRQHIEQARRLLLSISPVVRRETIVWFIGRNLQGGILDSNDDMWLSRDDAVHREYSSQFYPKNLQVCDCHGIL